MLLFRLFVFAETVVLPHKQPGVLTEGGGGGGGGGGVLAARARQVRHGAAAPEVKRGALKRGKDMELKKKMLLKIGYNLGLQKLHLATRETNNVQVSKLKFNELNGFLMGL